MKTEQEYFEEGQTIQEYMDNMSKLKEESFQVYENFKLPDDGFAEQLKDFPVHFLIITEDWCGDAMMINPVIRKLAEAAEKETRVVYRDEDTDLIDRHLTNGSRSIPIVLILNDQGELVGEWGPRAPEVQQIVDEFRDSLPDKEDPDFKEKQKEMIQELTRRYKEEPELWHYVYENFKGTLLVLDAKGEVE
ncbi:thioredoxin family protein [Allobacillus sp. GCM10007491]|uniref:Thioredoxin family protein n=2 Tax=Allobacillus TaxID=1400133 RepID=A0A941HTL3_9BACI|nr:MULTISPECIES: thioredoxin family protein [Allobacillus]MBR7553930.1 thioredoxin family protein [Allobacillus saliphilus]MBU6080841.1 thioredoxin family protein [Allobacillus halotolerans]